MTINLNDFQSINDIHDYIARELNFPKYYGKNLDALYDMLSTYISNIEIRIYGISDIDGKYADDVNAMLDMFEYLQDEDDNFKCFVDDYEL